MKLLLIVLLLCCTMLLPVLAEEERPANFIFLIDVSGSMLYKSEMVQGADGSKVTLFEALRQALAQIVQDRRLINSKSRATFITFGTTISEKSSWPSKLTTEEDRVKLVEDIQSSSQLDADKHGDTYMGGALAAALERANALYAQADPCTTTFIIMLTDGWDEPPAGATAKVKNVAAKLLARSQELQQKLGVKIWRVLVIGLQELPDRKAGTTTAKEVADLLKGDFLDITKQADGTSASEKIFLALKKTIEGLRGEIKVANTCPPMLDFGSVDGNGNATAALPLQLKSCYAEDITGVHDNTAQVDEHQSLNLMRGSDLSRGNNAILISKLPGDAVTLKLAQPEYTIAPKVDEHGGKGTATEPISLVLEAHSNCPAGHFVGTLELISTARVPKAIAYKVSVPARLVPEHDTLTVRVTKPGLFWTESTETTIEESLKEMSAAKMKAKGVYTVVVTPGPAHLKQRGKQTCEAVIDTGQINGGKPVKVVFDTNTADRQPLRLTLFIPARQPPGIYVGKLGLVVSGVSDVVAPTEIDYEVIVHPSIWEQIAPVAVPMFALLLLTSAVGTFLWIKNIR